MDGDGGTHFERLRNEVGDKCLWEKIERCRQGIGVEEGVCCWEFENGLKKDVLLWYTFKDFGRIKGA